MQPGPGSEFFFFFLRSDYSVPIYTDEVNGAPNEANWEPCSQMRTGNTDQILDRESGYWNNRSREANSDLSYGFWLQEAALAD